MAVVNVAGVDADSVTGDADVAAVAVELEGRDLVDTAGVASELAEAGVSDVGCVPAVPTLADVRGVAGCVVADADVGAVVAGVAAALVAGVAVLRLAVSAFTEGVTYVPEDTVIDGVEADAVVGGMAVDRDADNVSVTKAAHNAQSI